MKRIYSTYCTACALHMTRRKIVKPIIGSCHIVFITTSPDKTDEITGYNLSGHSGKILRSLTIDAGIFTDYMVVPCVFCRPCDSKSSPNREPLPIEILTCMKNVHDVIQKINPEKIVLLGDTAKKYYGKEYPRALRLIHPDILLRTGGRASPYYSRALRSLIDFMKQE